MAVFPHTRDLPKNRADLEDLIEAAIARLDDMDGDCDLEDGHDAEPDDHETSSVPSFVENYDCSPILMAVRS